MRSVKLLSAAWIMISVLCPRLQADTDVIDQHGKARHFFSEVLGEGQVIVNFIYTHCEGVCPGQGQRFERLQNLLGPMLGQDVRLVSVSIDPERDTPAALKSWSETFHAGEHWTLVTGSKSSMEAIAKTILGMSVNRSEHSPFLAVRGKKGQWQRLYGLASASTIITTLDEG